MDAVSAFKLEVRADKIAVITIDAPGEKMNTLKAEFGKIIWPDQKSIGKQTAAVLSVSVVLGVLITIIDMIVQYGVDFLVK